MRIAIAPSGAINLDEAPGTGARAALGLMALLPILPLAEFWPGLWPLSLGAALVWLICLGAVMFSVFAIWAAVFSIDQNWRIESGRLLVERKTLLGVTRHEYRAGDVGAVSVVADSWTDGADVFHLRFATADGPLDTPGDENRQRIEQLRDAAARLLGRQRPA